MAGLGVADKMHFRGMYGEISDTVHDMKNQERKVRYVPPELKWESVPRRRFTATFDTDAATSRVVFSSRMNASAAESPRALIRITSILSSSKSSAATPSSAAAMSAFYERCVARAAHGAPASRLWGALARTVLKGQLWGYFEGETDFGRQLEAFEPNAKFSAPAAAAAAEGGEASPLKELVAEARRAYDVKHVYAWHALHGYWRGASADLGAAEGVAEAQSGRTASVREASCARARVVAFCRR